MLCCHPAHDVLALFLELLELHEEGLHLHLIGNVGTPSPFFSFAPALAGISSPSPPIACTKGKPIAPIMPRCTARIIPSHVPSGSILYFLSLTSPRHFEDGQEAVDVPWSRLGGLLRQPRAMRDQGSGRAGSQLSCLPLQVTKGFDSRVSSNEGALLPVNERPPARQKVPSPLACPPRCHIACIPCPCHATPVFIANT